MNNELERVSIEVGKSLNIEKEIVYKVIRWGWDEVKNTLEGMDEISVEFPKFGQWIINLHVIKGAATYFYDELVYNERMRNEKKYSLFTNKYLKLKKFLDSIENKIGDGYKVNYKKPITYYGGNKKLPNN